MFKVYVDGQHGTTGLRIHEYLSNHPNIEIMEIDYNSRRDIKVRKKYINNADLVFLCLPDSAAIDAVKLIENNTTKIIDASTAHRVNDDWVYGIPELNKNQREKIKNSNRVTVPGCHASATNIALSPLVQEGIVPTDYPLTITSITGYSGGGKNMIASYRENDAYLKTPRQYALSLNHKHLPEITKYCTLNNSPIFVPTVCDYYKGLAVSIPLFPKLLTRIKTPKDICSFLTEYYANEKFINVIPYGDDSLLFEGGFDVTGSNDTNMVDIFLFGNDEKILLVSRLDNLGKGASGAAVQNMNIMLGINEDTGLV